jgi:hypothetical protein
MSIGNLKDYGNQGNNFPWQLKVLQGLQEIANQTAQPLTCAEDSIALCAGGDLLTSTTIGADTGLDVNIIGGVSLFAEDSAHASGNIGTFVMGVRNDSNTAMTSANGDYSPVAVNANGAVAINDGGNSITVDGTVSLSSGTLTALENVTVQNAAGAAAVNIQDGGNVITVDIEPSQFTKAVTPNLIVSTGTTGSIATVVYSISFASNGLGPALISTDSGTTFQSIPAGTTINLDAGGLGWYYDVSKFAWDTTAVGASLIITYNS